MSRGRKSFLEGVGLESELELERARRRLKERGARRRMVLMRIVRE